MYDIIFNGIIFCGKIRHTILKFWGSKLKEKIEIKSEKIKKSKQPVTIDYEHNKLSTAYFLPLLIITAIVPLITYAKYVDLANTTQALYWTGQQTYLDFFSYRKSTCIVLMTAISLILYLVLYFDKKLPLKNLKQYYIPLGIYILFVIISTVMSIDKQTALWGFVDMYQGMFVLISYSFITFLVINFVNSERDVMHFVKAFLFLIIVEGLIGAGQYFGHDFFQTGFGKSLIVPSSIQVENLSFSFGPKTIYGTLFNTNFVGSFATIVLPLSIAFLLISKNIKQRVISSLAIILSLFLWIGCNSRAGYFGVVISSIFAIWLFRKLIKKYWKASIGLIAVLIILFVGLNSISGGNLANRIKSFNIAKQLELIKEQNEKSLKFEDIVLGENAFSIKTNKETLNFKIDDNKLFFLDENNKELRITTKDNQITINDEKYSNYVINIAEDYPGVTVLAYGKRINFYFDKEGVKIIGSGGRLTKPTASPFYGPLKGLETIGSNRGYEWGATIPMLKKYALVGAGPDNYPIAFNQDDFIAKLNLIDFDANIVVDKPHNMYLQTGVNTGVISIVALMILWGVYIVSSLLLYSKINFTKAEEIIGGACMISVIGYLSAGMFNDNVNSVAPLFWLILGLGISINARLKRKMKES